MSDSDSDSDSDIDLPQPLPAIHAAVRNLDVDALRRALAAGASIEETDVAGWTPLYRACKNRVLASSVELSLNTGTKGLVIVSRW